MINVNMNMFTSFYHDITCDCLYILNCHRCCILLAGSIPTVMAMYNTSDMQGMVWGEPELSHVWEFDHMVFFHSHK